MAAVLRKEFSFDNMDIAVKELLEKQGYFRVTKVLKDLAGLDRVVFAR